jgi:hypothetical protein
MQNFYILIQVVHVVLVKVALRSVFIVHPYISVKCLKNSKHILTYL